MRAAHLEVLAFLEAELAQAVENSLNARVVPGFGGEVGEADFVRAAGLGL